MCWLAWCEWLTLSTSVEKFVQKVVEARICANPDGVFNWVESAASDEMGPDDLFLQAGAPHRAPPLRAPSCSITSCSTAATTSCSTLRALHHFVLLRAHFVRFALRRAPPLRAHSCSITSCSIATSTSCSTLRALHQHFVIMAAVTAWLADGVRISDPSHLERRVQGLRCDDAPPWRLAPCSCRTSASLPCLRRGWVVRCRCAVHHYKGQ